MSEKLGDEGRVQFGTGPRRAGLRCLALGQAHETILTEMPRILVMRALVPVAQIVGLARFFDARIGGAIGARIHNRH
ncbi:MAG TPA: hypothetical protein VGF56_04045 [Rhizomicrobium sp.]